MKVNTEFINSFWKSGQKKATLQVCFKQMCIKYSVIWGENITDMNYET